MPLTSSSTEAEYFEAFKIFDVTYKAVKDHAIQTSVLVPKSACKGPRPVIVRFHGGGLVSGTRLHAPWFPPYLLTYALAHSAVIVTPDYRLLPEANGLDILSDISSLWTWLSESLQSYIILHDPINTPAGINLNEIIVSGESAGGWLAMQSAFMHPDRIKAILAIFPMLDLGDEHFTAGGRPTAQANGTETNGIDGDQSETTSAVNGRAHPNRTDKAHIMNIGTLLDTSVVDAYIRSARQDPSRVVSSVTPPERADLSIAMFQHGRVGELLGPERALYPLEVLEDLGRAGAQLPPLLIVHGVDDTVVPVAGSERFVRVWETWQRESAVRLVLRPGEHGFEAKARVDEESWLREALDWVAERWLN